MTVTQLIDQFLRERKDCGVRTLRTYGSRTASLREAFGDRDCSTLTRHELLEWIDAETHWPKVEGRPHPSRQPGTPKAPDTVRLVLTVLKMLEDVAIDHDAIAGPWLKPKDYKKPKPRQRDRLPTTEETELILARAPEDFRIVYSALRLTGARPGELSAARIEQIRTEGSTRMLVLDEHKTKAKTGRDRKIPIGGEVAELFDSAIGTRRRGLIFRRADKTPWTTARIYYRFCTIRDDLGLEEHLIPYLARHEFGTRVTKIAGIKTASDLLGHSSITTTSRYAHPSDDDLREAQEAAFRSTTGDKAA